MKLFFVSVCCLFYTCVVGQVYTGTVANDSISDPYYCTLKINKDSTICLVFQDSAISFYEEYVGNFISINNTQAKLRLTTKFRVFSAEGIERHLGLSDDSNFNGMNTISLTYQDNFKISYDLNKPPVIAKTSDPIRDASGNVYYYYFRDIQLDPKHFHYKDKVNGYDGYNRIKTTVIKLDLNHINPITGKKIVMNVIDEGYEIHRIPKQYNADIVFNHGNITIAGDDIMPATSFLLKKEK